MGRYMYVMTFFMAMTFVLKVKIIDLFSWLCVRGFLLMQDFNLCEWIIMRQCVMHIHTIWPWPKNPQLFDILSCLNHLVSLFMSSYLFCHLHQHEKLCSYLYPRAYVWQLYVTLVGGAYTNLWWRMDVLNIFMTPIWPKILTLMSKSYVILHRFISQPEIFCLLIKGFLYCVGE